MACTYQYRRYGKQSDRGKKRAFVIFFFLCLVIVLIIAGFILIGNRSRGKNVKTDYIFKQDEASKSYVDLDSGIIPDYSGEDYIFLNNNHPNFTIYDCDHISGENYVPLDSLGRCGTAYALLDHSMMPTEKRGEIGSIKPSGWKQEKYPGIIDAQPPYLYNRSHLIAYALTGENANELNLITGTRHFNTEIMLPYELQVARYLDHSDNHVLYRVSPYFKGNELIARGVEMEALSVEDNGEGVSFHVFCYNIQPGIRIDYLTGSSMKEQ